MCIFYKTTKRNNRPSGSVWLKFNEDSVPDCFHLNYSPQCLVPLIDNPFPLLEKQKKMMPTFDAVVDLDMDSDTELVPAVPQSPQSATTMMMVAQQALLLLVSQSNIFETRRSATTGQRRSRSPSGVAPRIP